LNLIEDLLTQVWQSTEINQKERTASISTEVDASHGKWVLFCAPHSFHAVVCDIGVACLFEVRHCCHTQYYEMLAGHKK
jgi:hypothetical protein